MRRLEVKAMRLVLTSVGEQALAPYTTQCVGVDLSEKMVEAYNARARNQVSSVSAPFHRSRGIRVGLYDRGGKRGVPWAWTRESSYLRSHCLR